MTSAATRGLNLLARSIHVKMYPTPPTLSERREVLRVLQRFGDVEMFRSMKWDRMAPISNAFLCILSTAEAATAAIDASPIRFRLIVEPPTFEAPQHPSHRVFGISSDDEGGGRGREEGAGEGEGDAGQETSSATASAATAIDTTARAYELNISRTKYPHEENVTKAPLYGPFRPVSSRRSPVAADLADRIPQGVSKAALCDWDSDGIARRKGGVGMVARLARREEREAERKVGEEPWVMMARKVREVQAEKDRGVRTWGGSGSGSGKGYRSGGSGPGYAPGQVRRRMPEGE